VREHTGTSIAIGAVSTFAFTIWAGVIAVMLWSGITVYAIVKWIGSPQDHASATTLLVVLVGTVAVFPLLIAIAIYLVSKQMRYARSRGKRGNKDAEQLSLPVADAATD
jgi:heme/copper-type cytochrome/quinol oxidase subunit 2